MNAGLLINTRQGAGEIASLTERLRYMQAVRAGMVAIALITAIAVLHVDTPVRRQLLVVSAAYLLLAGAAELLRRRFRRHNLAVLSALLLVDGLYLAWVGYLTGGTQSPLRVLLYLQLISVTLLASYRTGLKVALWLSLVSLVMLYAQASDLIQPTEPGDGIPLGPGVGLDPLSIFNVSALWLVALVTAGFSALNERELRRRKIDFQSLASMGSALEASRRPSEVANVLLERLCAEYRFSRGVVAAVEADGVTLMAQRGRDVHPPTDGGGLDTTIREAALAHEPILLRALDEADDPWLAAALPQARRVLVAPMFADGGLVAVLVLEHAPERSWGIERRVVEMVAQSAAHAGLALRNAMLLEQVQRMADSDALTGLPNRRLFELTLQRELARAMRAGDPLSLLLLDVDHFKAYNDTHGHPAGDAALAVVAEVLTKTCREPDMAARYGGEEFAVVLPGADAERALTVAERLRSAVAGAPTAAAITASVGVATLADDALDLEHLVEKADQGLYEAKRSGRNRVARPPVTRAA